MYLAEKSVISTVSKILIDQLPPIIGSGMSFWTNGMKTPVVSNPDKKKIIFRLVRKISEKFKTSSCPARLIFSFLKTEVSKSSEAGGVTVGAAATMRAPSVAIATGLKRSLGNAILGTATKQLLLATGFDDEKVVLEVAQSEAVADIL